MQTVNLHQTLYHQCQENIQFAEQLKQLSLEQLSWRKSAESWNILECLEHLNLYGDYYLPAIEQAIRQSKSKAELMVKPGLLGAYFAKSMLPKEKLNKMKTFKDKNPLNSKLGTEAIDKFIEQQNILLTLLKQSENVSLNKVKIKISISKLIKLRLGDTFQFYCNHILRHLKQIESVRDSWG